MSKNKLLWFSLPALIILAIISILVIRKLTPKEDDWFPTQDYVRENGYPVNDNGETYGPNIEMDTFAPPDLIAVVGQKKEKDYGTTPIPEKDKVRGYVKQNDVFYAGWPDSRGPESPEEAMLLQESKSTESVYIPVYRSDGQTKIGVFRVN